MPLLNATGLVKRFGGLSAVDGLDVTVEKGEVLGLIGPNGAGKTTLVDILSGVQIPSAGRIHYRGTDITRLSSHHRCRLGLARTFQIPLPFNDMTVLENVMLGALFGHAGRMVSVPAARKIAEGTLERAGLRDAGRESVESLPVAARKRLEVARCLASEPDVLFLDEPLGGLNNAEVKEALGLIRQLRDEGVTLVFIEHLVSAVAAVSDRILVLANGRELAVGTPAEVLSDAKVKAAYLGDLEGVLTRRSARKSASASARVTTT